ncbi:MAG: hypothetical protein WBG50_10595 [Desulfomonilaceae bacterium]
MSDIEYEEFSTADVMKSLTESNDIRIEEEMTRPRVEVWPDDLWQLWVQSHDESKRSLLCHLPSMQASPFCAMGYH